MKTDNTNEEACECDLICFYFDKPTTGRALWVRVDGYRKKNRRFMLCSLSSCFSIQAHSHGGAATGSPATVAAFDPRRSLFIG